MSSPIPVNEFLLPLKRAAPADANQFTPEIREQLKSIADPYRNHQGQIGLFTGASGTGKTLAARVLGSNLGFDIYRVDLAAMTSKYIGETEKNLSSLLDTGSMQEVVLLFDEADSLFGKRGDVQSANDRFANQETNFLLQRIEEFEGIVILATNFRDDLDDVVLSRVSWDINFTRSEPKRRTSWWDRILEWLQRS